MPPFNPFSNVLSGRCTFSLFFPESKRPFCNASDCVFPGVPAVCPIPTLLLFFFLSQLLSPPLAIDGFPAACSENDAFFLLLFARMVCTLFFFVPLMSQLHRYRAGRIFFLDDFAVPRSFVSGLAASFFFFRASKPAFLASFPHSGPTTLVFTQSICPPSCLCQCLSVVTLFLLLTL